ncbi:MAG: putative protein-disulfide isomerase [Cocleimonas sp.]|jgi:putative protein-disulfide isomerase
MCSWCWGFRPTWTEIKTNLPDTVEIKYLLGGLAPDSDEPMSESMKSDIAGYWRRIQQHIPGTQFNFDFWDKCEPRRSTYPACRAVIAARKQNPDIELEMIDKVQTAYYMEAQNPSDDSTLIDIAKSLDLDEQQFASDLNAPETQQQLESEMMLGRQLGAQGFPSIVLAKDGQAQYLPLDYNSAENVVNMIKSTV